MEDLKTIVPLLKSYCVNSDGVPENSQLILGLVTLEFRLQPSRKDFICGLGISAYDRACLAALATIRTDINVPILGLKHKEIGLNDTVLGAFSCLIFNPEIPTVDKLHALYLVEADYLNPASKCSEGAVANFIQDLNTKLYLVNEQDHELIAKIASLNQLLQITTGSNKTALHSKYCDLLPLSFYQTKVLPPPRDTVKQIIDRLKALLAGQG